MFGSLPNSLSNSKMGVEVDAYPSNLELAKFNFVGDKLVDEKNLRRALTKTKMKVTITNPQGKKTTAAVIPDGYFKLHNPKKKKSSHFFIEVDLKTETGQTRSPVYKDWARKMKSYISFYNDIFLYF